LRTYHYRQFYKFSGNRPYGFTGVVADRAAPEDFIKALVMQQTEKSAKLLDTMLIYLPKQKCMPDKERIIDEVINEIWEHPCVAYTKLREKIRLKAEKNKESYFTLNMDGDRAPIDTTKKRYYWLE
jgi:hypothetical protein